MNQHDWLPVKEWTERRIGQAQIRLEAALNPTDTAHMRGEIRAYRALLAWGSGGFSEPAPQVSSLSYPGTGLEESNYS